MDRRIIQYALDFLPELIGYLRDLFMRDNPDAPEPTDEDIIIAFNNAFAASLAKDEAWLAAHPEEGESQ
jgi:hypothetical protein